MSSHESVEAKLEAAEAARDEARNEAWANWRSFKAADAENRRLREALERIALGIAGRNDPGVPRTDWEIARAALTDGSVDIGRPDIGIGYTLATGRLFCHISEFHEYAERLLARPIMTHEFEAADIWDEMRARFEALVLELSCET